MFSENVWRSCASLVSSPTQVRRRGNRKSINHFFEFVLTFSLFLFSSLFFPTSCAIFSQVKRRQVLSKHYIRQYKF